MKTIMLVCTAGMSTSLMVNKMKKVAVEQNIDADIFAVPAIELESIIDTKDIDVILLGPQVKYMKSKFESKLEGRNIPIDVINMQYYGMMDGKKVLEQALDIINKNSN
ncbi:PTS sugar transporter subunit IIB [Sporanaerobacter acetigenes]|uniref:PTS system, cellobiose-specific IIB component n=1 Tax=Sporanaerobacter acetigenes DSM 13106 TaxID=1123281 RepID=A0A1M5X3N3_9FIRM|nr:PTS system, cellobiose-specific IIB component [Sporanaerobacter acetigenes DSM 13106]